MVPARRVVGVTIGLAGAGTVVGGIAGAVSLAMAALVSDGVVHGPELLVGAFFGAPLGAVFAPTLAWLLLRRVPLGKMFLWCAAGTALGGLGGWILSPVLGLPGAVAGCVLASLALWHGDPSGGRA